MPNEIKILRYSMKDYFTKEMLQIVLLPLIVTALVLYMFFFSLADIGLDSLENTQLQIQQKELHTQDGQINETEVNQSYTGSSILDFLLRYTASWWIVSFFVYAIGLFAIGYIAIFISLIIVGFLTPRILAIIHKRHYSDLDINSNYSIFDSIMQIIKSTLVMFILFVLLFPFYFIPFVNFIAINVPFFYFFHKMLHFDIKSTITTKEEFINIYYNDKNNMRLRTLFLYIVSMIPFVSFFIAVFYIIYLGHVYFIKISQQKPSNSKVISEVKTIQGTV